MLIIILSLVIHIHHVVHHIHHVSNLNNVLSVSFYLHFNYRLIATSSKVCCSAILLINRIYQVYFLIQTESMLKRAKEIKWNNPY